MRGTHPSRSLGALALGILLTSLITVDIASAKALPQSPHPMKVSHDRNATDQLIVRMADGSTPDAATLTAVTGESVGLKRSLKHGAWVVRLGGRHSQADAETLAQRVAALPGVAYAEPDRVLFPALVPTDPRWSEQWDLFTPTSTTFGANLPAAWDVSRGTSDVVVAVIDTGITNHIDLAGQVLPGYDFIGDTLVANDGNGRDADASDPGDWVTSAENTSGYFAGCGASNSSWHGTHVSGTIAAVADNGIGISGIAPGVKILPVRVLGKCGGYTSDIADGMRWAAGLAVSGVPSNPNPASVLNLSLGGSGSCSITEQQAISDVTAIGTTVVVAAGNSNSNSANFTPASCNNVITVAATGVTGNKAYYSNYGTGVEIAAQGGDANLTPGRVLSTMNAGTTSPTTDTYVGYQGTSMATPHVAGVAALLKSVQPSLTPAALVALLQAQSTPFPAGSTCTTSLCGAGILNAGAAVSAAATANGPRVLGAFSKTTPAPGAVAQSNSLTLQWTASAGATDYSYCLVAGLTAPCTTWTSVGNTLSAPVTGLAGNTLYSWQVRATNGTNSADANVSLRSSFTTGAVATAPAAFAKSSPANGATGQATALTLSWAASTGATSYEYCLDATLNSACDGSWVSTGTSRSVSFSGFAYGATYEWQVRARNTVGTADADAGAWWRFTTAAAPKPGAFAKSSPANNATGRSRTLLSLSWAASTGAVSYEYCLDTVNNNVCDTSWVSTGTARTVNVGGLASKKAYYWQVRARNTAGTTDANSGTWWKFTTTT